MIGKLFSLIGASWRALTFTSGKFSHLKMWSNIALGMGTWVIFKLTMNDKITVDMFVVYLAACTGARITDKYLTNRQETTRYQYGMQYNRPMPSSRPMGAAKTPTEDFE